MLDGILRPLIDPPLNRAARVISRGGLSANALTAAGAGVAAGAAAAITLERYGLGLTLILLNRLIDGLDGPLARIRGSTDFGGFLDIVCDFLFYAAVPLAFGVADPRNLLPALVLLASFLCVGTSFLAYAVIAAKRGIETRSRGAKSFYFDRGIAEGAETIIAFALACLWPGWFPQIAYGFAALCALTTVVRIAGAWSRFG